MAEINDIQYEKVVQAISAAITTRRLCDELIDHCCCAIESHLEDGISFDQALPKALRDLAPEGLDAYHLSYQQTFQSQIPLSMKTTLYFSGFIAAFCILLGITMRQLHWPGANLVLMTGDLSLVVCMIVLMGSMIAYPQITPPLIRLRIWSGAIAGFLLGSGSAFKLMHWPGANIQFVLGMGLLIFFFLPLFFWQLYRREIAS